jgi:hypothetical protein
MKRALLEMEGIRFDHTGRVIVNDFYYRPPSSPTLDNKIQPIAKGAY